MVKPTLLVLAAGMGSRYGSLKQMDGVGPNNEAIIDYSVYDAIRAGFGKVVFVIRHSFEKEFREVFSAERFGGRIAVEFVFQELDYLPEGASVPEGRVKPWGTNHAVMMAADAVHEPFAVINADDYYGTEAFETIIAELDKLHGAQEATMVAYRLKNTVSKFGTVTRGVCIAENNILKKVKETYKIKLMPDGTIRDTSETEDGPVLAPDTLVSMNLWGYPQDILPVMEKYFADFLAALPEDDLKAECLLPVMMDDLTAGSEISISVLSTRDRWFGLTYIEDKPGAVEALTRLHENGTYPPTLWNG